MVSRIAQGAVNYLTDLYNQTTKVAPELEKLKLDDLKGNNAKAIANKIEFYEDKVLYSIGKKPGLFTQMWLTPLNQEQIEEAFKSIIEASKSIKFEKLTEGQAEKIHKFKKIFEEIIKAHAKPKAKEPPLKKQPSIQKAAEHHRKPSPMYEPLYTPDKTSSLPKKPTHTRSKAFLFDQSLEKVNAEEAPLKRSTTAPLNVVPKPVSKTPSSRKITQPTSPRPQSPVLPTDESIPKAPILDVQLPPVKIQQPQSAKVASTHQKGETQPKEDLTGLLKGALASRRNDLENPIEESRRGTVAESVVDEAVAPQEEPAAPQPAIEAPKVRRKPSKVPETTAKPKPSGDLLADIRKKHSLKSTKTQKSEIKPMGIALALQKAADNISAKEEPTSKTKSTNKTEPTRTREETVFEEEDVNKK
jgi:hypothetical protein